MDRYAPKPNIKKGDEVLVLAGKDRGKQGTINRMVIKGESVRAVVAGLNIAKSIARAVQGCARLASLR